MCHFSFLSFLSNHPALLLSASAASDAVCPGSAEAAERLSTSHGRRGVRAEQPIREQQWRSNGKKSAGNSILAKAMQKWDTSISEIMTKGYMQREIRVCKITVYVPGCATKQPFTPRKDAIHAHSQFDEIKLQDINARGNSHFLCRLSYTIRLL